MPRATFNPDELDQNVRIEDGVQRTLREHSIAEVSVSVLDACYEVRGAGGGPVESTLQDRCGAICRAVEANFEIRGANVWFHRKRGDLYGGRSGGGA